MLVPISWLKEYVEVKLPLKELMWKMTEAGLTCESYKKVGKDTVLDVEVTANRPDWMSMVGVAREVAAIENVGIKEPKIKELPKKSKNFPLDLKNDFNLLTRWSGVTIAGISIKPSPKWMQERLIAIGLRPINNIVDITNYVMFELGIPMHAFDYDEIMGQVMTVTKSKGGENFKSVDEISYELPKNAMIIKDAERIIDLCGIKGGYNSGIKKDTKNIFIHCTIDNPVLTRRSSIALGLRSDASAIYERGPDKGGTIKTLKRMANLILEYAGGEIASDIYDLKKESFEPWKLQLTYEKLEKVLGIKIDSKKVIGILTKLNLKPKKSAKGVACTIPTYRSDLKIEEDLAEEVARIYGYNNFPKTLPVSSVNQAKIPYYFDDSFISTIKELMVGSGFSETMTLSLVSESLIKNFNLKTNDNVRIINPVSSDYEYLRTTLIPNLIYAAKLNNREVKLFEIDKVYPSEKYKTAAIMTGSDFRTFKGTIDLICDRLNLDNPHIDFETNTPYWHPSKGGKLMINTKIVGEFGFLNPTVLEKIGIKKPILAFELDVDTLKKYEKRRIFKIVPENPPQYEDITVILPPKSRIGNVRTAILSADKHINDVQYVGSYGQNYTFHITYQSNKKTLTNKEVDNIRKLIVNSIKSKFGAQLKV